jgi:hypothetical protein
MGDNVDKIVHEDRNATLTTRSTQGGSFTHRVTLLPNSGTIGEEVEAGGAVRRYESYPRNISRTRENVEGEYMVREA